MDESNPDKGYLDPIKQILIENGINPSDFTMTYVLDVLTDREDSFSSETSGELYPFEGSTFVDPYGHCRKSFWRKKFKRHRNKPRIIKSGEPVIIQRKRTNKGRLNGHKFYKGFHVLH